jgi:hypothetical protein
MTLFFLVSEYGSASPSLIIDDDIYETCDDPEHWSFKVNVTEGDYSKADDSLSIQSELFRPKKVSLGLHVYENVNVGTSFATPHQDQPPPLPPRMYQEHHYDYPTTDIRSAAAAAATSSEAASRPKPKPRGMVHASLSTTAVSVDEMAEESDSGNTYDAKENSGGYVRYEPVDPSTRM